MLVVGPPGGGTVDLYAPSGFLNLYGKWLHFYHDVRPFYYCCKGEFSDCREYYKHRPSDDGSRYVLQPPGTHNFKKNCVCNASYNLQITVSCWYIKNFIIAT